MDSVFERKEPAYDGECEQAKEDCKGKRLMGGGPRVQNRGGQEKIQQWQSQLNFPARRKSKERMSRKAEIPRKIKTVYGI